MENYSALSRDKAFRKKSIWIAGLIIIFIAVLYVFLFSVEKYLGGSSPYGEGGSSYATAAFGSRAWSDLLTINGYKVTRDRGTVTLPEIKYESTYDYSAPPLTLNREAGVVVVLNGSLPDNEIKSVRQFVYDGGRLISDNPALLDAVIDRKISISADGSKSLEPSSSGIEGLSGINSVTGEGVGSISYSRIKNAENVLVDKNKVEKNNQANVAIFQVGQGDVVALMDLGTVSNTFLDKTDNALFALRIAGSKGNHIVFAEGIHGYGDANGFAGLPMSWRITIVGLFLALVIFAAAKGRRFGVGEEPNRELPPRRIKFAHAMAQAMRKSKRKG
ncbi:MAG: DUF4350 domain-containing protein [Acidimicrobiia bacterium]